MSLGAAGAAPGLQPGRRAGLAPLARGGAARPERAARADRGARRRELRGSVDRGRRASCWRRPRRRRTPDRPRGARPTASTWTRARRHRDDLLGAARHPVHGRVRRTTRSWRSAPGPAARTATRASPPSSRRTAGCDDEAAAFNLYGGATATNVGPITARRPGLADHRQPVSGPAVWHSDDGRDFTIEEDVPGLADAEDFVSLAQGAAWDGDAWVVVGGGNERSTLDREPVAWESPDADDLGARRGAGQRRLRRPRARDRRRRRPRRAGPERGRLRGLASLGRRLGAWASASAYSPRTRGAARSCRPWSAATRAVGDHERRRDLRRCGTARTATSGRRCTTPERGARDRRRARPDGGRRGGTVLLLVGRRHGRAPVVVDGIAATSKVVESGMKNIGFLSFGHWNPSPHSQTRTAADALHQSIDLAVAAEELGADGAYYRVHHFARQLASPFPLLAAVGARTSRIEIGTGVIDMRYENPLYMAEDAGVGRPDLRRPAAARHQPRITGAGDRGLPLLRPPPGRTATTRRWPASTPRSSCGCSRGRGSPSPTRARCSPTRRACCASSRTPRGCATASGGAPRPAPPPSGPPSRA